MGNKANRGPRRKKQLPHFFKKMRHRTDNRLSATSTINIVSVLCPTLAPSSNIEYDYNETVDPIATTTENVIEHSENYPQMYNEPSTYEIAYVGDNETLPIKIEPIESETEFPESNINFENHKHERIDAFENKCRLCLTEGEMTWIDVFASEPYEDCDDITPSNILGIIEQFTAVKISKDDRLPYKVCTTCLQSLRFMYNFREKSLCSQGTLQLALSKHDEQNEQKKVLVNAVRLKPIQHLAANRDEYKKITGGTCETCGKVFERLSKLQYHLNRHTGTKPFVCAEPYCEKSFYTPQNLKSHVTIVHSIEPRYKCDVENCNRVFNQANKMRDHRTTHFPPTIPCTICGKLLRSQASVIKHRASHAERRFKCDDCGKSFQTAYTLRTHQRIHTNEKPYICCKCGEAFAYNCLLKSHTEKYHPS